MSFCDFFIEGLFLISNAFKVEFIFHLFIAEETKSTDVTP